MLAINILSVGSNLIFLKSGARIMENAPAIDPIEPEDDRAVTVNHRYLRRAQLWHATLVTTLFPVLGVAAGIILTLAWGWDSRVLWILGLSYVLTVIGLEVGYHRYFTHLAFKTPSWVKAVLAILGSMCAQGPVIYWVANHRRHHQFSDQKDDPHSPNAGYSGLSWRGFWHAYVGWTYTHATPNTARFAQDWLQDPTVFRINQHYFLWLSVGALLPGVWGMLWIGGWQGFLLGVVWGGAIRIFLVTNAALGVTSLCHIAGSRPYRTRDQSRNVLWLVLPTFGQAWHNHHHAFPRSAIMGFEWWQVDLGGWTIRLLEFFGLATDIRCPTAEQRARLLNKQ